MDEALQKYGSPHSATDGIRAYNLHRLLTTGIYSDLLIKCGPYEFNVHRAIVCTRSEYFTAACKPGAFKVCRFAEMYQLAAADLDQEGRDGVIELKATTNGNEEEVDADDPEAIKLMVNFLYFNDYKPQSIVISAKDANEGSEPVSQPKANEGYYRAAGYYGYGTQQTSESTTNVALTPSGDCNTLMHAKVYALGEKYGIESLKSVALAKFAEAITYAWNHPNFASTLRVVFCSTPDHDKGLRDLTVQAVLLHHAVLSEKLEIEKIVMGIEGLSYGLWKKNAPLVSKGPTCNTCGDVRITSCSRCHQYCAGCDCASALCGISKCLRC